MTRCVGLFVGLGLLAGSAAAQEKYTIKLRDPAKGETYQVSENNSEKSSSKATDPEGQKTLNEESKQEAKTFVYRSTVLEKPEGAERPTKLSRVYEKARITENGKERTLPYEGKTVLIEKKDDKYQFQIEGGEQLTGKDAAQLDREFNKETHLGTEIMRKVLLPKEPVAVGTSWKIDPAALAKEFSKNDGPMIDTDKVKASGKLLKTYKKGGKQYGVMEFNLELPLKELPLGKGTLPLDGGSKLAIRMTVDACIDGSNADFGLKGNLQMNLSGVIKQGGTPQAKLTVSVQSTGDESRTLVPKK